MRQPGIEVRPIKMISGESEFNEVFYTDATAPKDEVVGGVNNGWAVAMTLLGYERGEAAATVPIRFQAELDRLLILAKESGVDRRSEHPPAVGVVLQQGADHAVQRHAHADQVPATATSPGPTAAISKLYWSEYHKVVTELSLDILGAYAMMPTGRHPSSAFQTDDAGAPNSSASWVGTFLNARAGTIYAGSSQIQRNIIGEMVLGLPKEPKADVSRTLVSRGAVACAAGRCASVALAHGCSSVPRVAAATVVGRRPFLPIPPGDYVRFRLQTQYGSVKHRIEAVDVLNYLSWCKLHRALAS